MAATLREATRVDVTAMHRVRIAVPENRLTSSVITEEHYLPAIETTGRGWVIELDGTVVAFAVGNDQTGNIWALFVHPEHERRGYGRRLHEVMVSWLFSRGLAKLWLSTESGTRAQRFYEAADWQFKGNLADGQAMYELHLPKAP
jgi:ribosomal protein S18 acetylase RimI-like enzyme